MKLNFRSGRSHTRGAPRANNCYNRGRSSPSFLNETRLRRLIFTVRQGEFQRGQCRRRTFPPTLTTPPLFVPRLYANSRHPTFATILVPIKHRATPLSLSLSLSLSLALQLETLSESALRAIGEHFRALFAQLHLDR
jgi:hypothetical protein